MIKALLTQMMTQLDAAFNGAGTPIIIEGPARPPAGDLPRIVLGPGKLEMSTPFGDTPPGQMLPRETMDIFPVTTTNSNTVRGPYTLAQSPLEDTLSCRFHWNQPGDQLEGKKQRIYPRKEQQGDGFEVNYATRKVEVFYAAPLAGSPRLEVEYNYPAIFTLREFRQIIVLESYSDKPGDAEKWAALATAVLTTHTRALLDGANNSANRYSAGDYVARSLYNAFHLTEGVPGQTADSVFRYSLSFSVTGQLILERTFKGSAEVIRKIFSPGHKLDAGQINIEANLD